MSGRYRSGQGEKIFSRKGHDLPFKLLELWLPLLRALLATRAAAAADDDDDDGDDTDDVDEGDGDEYEDEDVEAPFADLCPRPPVPAALVAAGGPGPIAPLGRHSTRNGSELNINKNDKNVHSTRIVYFIAASRQNKDERDSSRITIMLVVTVIIVGGVMSTISSSWSF